MTFVGGRVEVICGSMFCGKTEELIRRLKRQLYANREIVLFKPVIDDRFSSDEVVSHNDTRMSAIPVASACEIPALVKTASIVGIDEVQFFDPGIVSVVKDLSDRNRVVILAGLDLDFKGDNFGSMPELLCLADEVVKLHAVCVICGEDASRTQRIINGEPARVSDPVIKIGDTESYQARCKEHHIVIRD